MTLGKQLHAFVACVCHAKARAIGTIFSYRSMTHESIFLSRFLSSASYVYVPLLPGHILWKCFRGNSNSFFFPSPDSFLSPAKQQKNLCIGFLYWRTGPLSSDASEVWAASLQSTHLILVPASCCAPSVLAPISPFYHTSRHHCYLSV